MLMASTKKYGYAAVNDSVIYTRGRQAEYKDRLHNTETEKKISQKALYLVMMLVVVILFCSWFGMIFFKSVISGVQMDINAVNSNIRTLEQENSVLEAEKINALDIASIKQSAESMGMSLPEACQVEYVDTVKDSANLQIID